MGPDIPSVVFMGESDVCLCSVKCFVYNIFFKSYQFFFSSRSHDVGVSPSSSPPPYSLDYESGKVLSPVPYEHSSFIDLPPSAFGND